MSVSLILVPVAIAVIGAVRARRERVAEGQSFLELATRMKDEAMLKEALDAYGCKKVEVERRLTATAKDTEIVFERSEDGTFAAWFVGSIEPAQAESFVDELEHEYTRLLQASLYRKVVDGAQAQGLVLESERVEPDNSVVLTLRVAGGA